MDLFWEDAYEIGFQLAHAHPEQDPLAVGLEDLHGLVLALAGFDDPPGAASEEQLEAIRMAWYDTWKDMREP